MSFGFGCPASLIICRQTSCSELQMRASSRSTSSTAARAAMLHRSPRNNQNGCLSGGHALMETEGCVDSRNWTEFVRHEQVAERLGAGTFEGQVQEF